MKNTKWLIYAVLPVLALVMLACDGEDKNLTGVAPYILLSAPDTANVGSSDPVQITVSLIPDAAGKDILFTASAGTFVKAGPDASSEGEEKIDVTGKATIAWFPPEEPGLVFISASVETLKADAEIEVTPVPDITFVEIPESMATEEIALFSVRIPAEWAGQAVEVNAPQVNLKAVGPTSTGETEGSNIFPLTDSLGMTSILLLAPATPQEIVVTVSLFGTIKSVLVEVK